MSLARNLSVASRGLHNYYARKPFSVSFEVTHCCNARCKHCHIRGMIENETRASPEELGRICRALNPVVAQASGGEPLLRRDLEDIVRAFGIPNRAPMVAITTNAALLSVERYTSLREAGVDEFSISLDYPDERHDEFRGIPGLLGKIGDLIARLKHVGDKRLLLCCVIQSDNFRLLPGMAQLATEWGIKLNFSCYTMMRTHDESYMLSADEVDELEDVVKQLVEHRARHMNILTSPHAFKNMVAYFRNRAFPGCGAGHKFLNVNPDGTLSPCGLIIKDYASRAALVEQFSTTNECDQCYTSMRANCEKPASRMLADNLATARMRAR